MLTISQASKKLKVNKKTLIRWDASGKFTAQRESTGNRVYDELDIQNHAQWFELRRKHRAHNRLLTAIRKEADRFTATQPLGMETPKFHKFEEMKKAYEALRKWETENKDILKEYSKLPHGFRAKVDPDA
jgi:DNA-binding transcriptional MerR regulator